MLIHAHDVDPEPLTIECLLGCTSYYAAEAFHERMVALAPGGWLVSTTEGAHQLSRAGSEAVTLIEGRRNPS
jgi:hypothetical protein